MGNKCLTPEEIVAIVDNELPAWAEGSVVRHLETCKPCKDKVSRTIASMDSFPVELWRKKRLEFYENLRKLIPTLPESMPKGE